MSDRTDAAVGRSRRTILLVDDHAIIAQAQAQALERHGYSVFTEHNGPDAITAAANQSVDLVIMDIELGRGGMSGTEAAREILSRRDVPIVFLTSHSDRGSVESAREVTHCGYVLKSSGEFVLLRSIETALELFDARVALKAVQNRDRDVSPPQLRAPEFPHTYVENDPDYLRRELYELVHEDHAIFDFLQAGSLDGMWYWDLEKPENEWMSPQFWRLFGIDPATKEHRSSEWQDLIFPEDLETALDNFHKHLADPSHPYDQVVRYRHADGGTVWVRCRGIALRDENGRPVRMIGAHNDLTELMRTEERLRKTIENYRRVVDEKQTLLREMNHRVKNNLAVVRSLIAAKSARLGNEVDLSDLFGQIESIRLIHETLSQSESISHVVLCDYVTALLHAIFGSADAVDVCVSDGNARVPTRQILPLGMIITELASNAMKHGFGESTQNRFLVDCAIEGESAAIRVSNSGRAFPEEVDIENPSTTGLQLVAALVAQLGGTIALARSPSPVFTIRFPIEG